MATLNLPPLSRAPGPRAWSRAQAAYVRAQIERDEKIRFYHRQGYPVEPDIMAAFGLSKTRVYQILDAGVLAGL